MMWRMVMVLLALVGVAGMVTAQTTVKNPLDWKAKLEGKARDAKVVDAEKKALFDLCTAVDKYARANGVDKAVAEIKKGAPGAFGKAIPKGIYYFGVSKWDFTAKKFNIVASVPPELTGLETKISDNKDVVGWEYSTAMLQATGKKDGAGAWLENLMFQDPGWAANKICRQVQWEAFLVEKGVSYSVWFDVWVDQ